MLSGEDLVGLRRVESVACVDGGRTLGLGMPCCVEGMRRVTVVPWEGEEAARVVVRRERRGRSFIVGNHTFGRSSGGRVLWWWLLYRFKCHAVLGVCGRAL